MAAEPEQVPIVVKVGGSLYDVPDLGPRLLRWLQTLPTSHIVLVPGGGATADVIRDLDRCHKLGEVRSHWLALRALGLNARFLKTLLPRSAVVSDWTRCPTHWEANRLPILDCFKFVRADEGNSGHLPHTWAVTSDSVAARLAVVMGAAKLILLKSVSAPAGWDSNVAGLEGIVDVHLATVAASLSQVTLVNLRAWQA
jgi:aspartokinase-like uncharacterized kinase